MTDRYGTDAFDEFADAIVRDEALVRRIRDSEATLSAPMTIAAFIDWLRAGTDGEPDDELDGAPPPRTDGGAARQACARSKFAGTWSTNFLWQFKAGT